MTYPEPARETYTNMASGNAQVAAQVGKLAGNLNLGTGVDARQSVGVDTQLDIVRAALADAHQRREIDADTWSEAVSELRQAAELLPAADDTARRRAIRALRRLKGLVEEFGELGAKVAVLIAAVQGVAG